MLDDYDEDSSYKRQKLFKNSENKNITQFQRNSKNILKLKKYTEI